MEDLLIQDRRDILANSASWFAAFIVLSTEALSAAALIDRRSVWALWIAAILTFTGWKVRSHKSTPHTRPQTHLSFSQRGLLVAIGFFVALTLVLALISPSSHVDPNAYHLPRVLHWIQNGSLDPYPTSIDRQIWVGPAAEYVHLHLRLLVGSSRVINIPQWLAYAGSIPIASLIARELGAPVDGQLVAAVFATTLPMGIAQGSGGHVDGFASFWLALSILWILRIHRRGIERWKVMDSVPAGCTIGMAILSKTTNALFLMPFVLWLLWSLLRDKPSRFRLLRLTKIAGLTTVAALSINAGWIYRNVNVWGSPLGNAAKYHLTSETITPVSVASGVVKNATLQLNVNNGEWISRLNSIVRKVHHRLGFDENDRRTTFGNDRFGVSGRVEDESAASNPLHLLLIVVAVGFAFAANSRDARSLLLATLVAGLFWCALFKWQYSAARFQFPLFVAAAGPVGSVLSRRLTTRFLSVISLIMIIGAMPALLANQRRPLIGNPPVFEVPYERQYFSSDSTYRAFSRVASTADSIGCAKLGLLADDGAPEYPLWELLQAHSARRIEIRHLQVANETRRFRSHADAEFNPCAIVKLTFFNRPEWRVPSTFRLVWGDSVIALYVNGGLDDPRR